jgi:glutathione S-transferase
MSIDVYAKLLYTRSMPNHRAVWIKLKEMGHKVELQTVMLWLGLISDESWIKIQTSRD